MTEAFHRRFPDLPQVACFDAAFHHDLPRVARLLPIPRRYEALGVRRYGFHGLSYAFLMGELARLTGTEAAQGRIILAHLGNGASLAAVRQGKSIDSRSPERVLIGMPAVGVKLMWASNDQGVAPDVVMACCGDVPTLETLAAVSILREHLPELKIRVVNVVDLMKLEPQTEHPHGLSDMDFDELFTKDKPVIFAFHAYPWLIHRLTYRRTNHDNIHVRGYKEEGTITTPFDMTVLNDLDRFHLVMDVIDRVPRTGEKGIYLKQQLKDKLIEHKQYIDKNGEDLPEIRNWKWSSPK